MNLLLKFIEIYLTGGLTKKNVKQLGYIFVGCTQTPERTSNMWHIAWVLTNRNDWNKVPTDKAKRVTLAVVFGFLVQNF